MVDEYGREVVFVTLGIELDVELDNIFEDEGCEYGE